MIQATTFRIAADSCGAGVQTFTFSRLADIKDFLLPEYNRLKMKS
jgi:hypothetical protein